MKKYILSAIVSVAATASIAADSSYELTEAEYETMMNVFYASQEQVSKSTALIILLK